MASPKKPLSYKLLLILLAGFFFLPNLFNKDISTVVAWDGKEKFNPGLSYINSISKLENYIDSIAANKNISKHSFEYVELLETVIEQRFYHGFSHLSLSENMIAAAAGKFIKEDYSCNVQPDEIIKHPNAACSQQSLVMMAVLRDNRMSYRSVGFPHHYAMEVLIDDNWYFFDANMEPGINKQQRMLSSWQHQNDNLKKYYDPNRCTKLDFQFGKGQAAIVGITNEIPARNSRIIYSVTAVLSKLLCCMPLLLIFFPVRLSIRRPFIAFNMQQKKTTLSFSA